MASEQGEEYRREIIRRLEREDQELEAKTREAEAESAEAKREREALKAAHLRAQLPFPPGDPCPSCWIMHGQDSQLYAVPHDDPDQYDRMKCSCGYYEDREVDQ